MKHVLCLLLYTDHVIIRRLISKSFQPEKDITDNNLIFRYVSLIVLKIWINNQVYKLQNTIATYHLKYFVKNVKRLEITVLKIDLYTKKIIAKHTKI